MPFAHVETKVVVKRSQVAGLGVWSTQTIRVGETVCYYSGECLGESAMVGNVSDYVLDLGGGYFLDAQKKYNCAGRYINDSRGHVHLRNNAVFSATMTFNEELGWHV